MVVPRYYELRLPILNFSKDGVEKNPTETREYLEDYFNLSENEKIPPCLLYGARSTLKKAGFLEQTKHRYLKITELGLEVLKQKHKCLTDNIISKFLEDKSKENNEYKKLFKTFICKIDKSNETNIVEEHSNPLKVTPDLLKLDDLKVKEVLLYRICGALNSGKHIIFDGAPGTGKTKIASKISESVIDNGFIDGYVLTTATSDWTTFDTIGGLMPDEKGKLYFCEGKFLEAIHENKWLIIDEINRADIDKAFGQLFTVLSGTDVELPYKDKNKNSISLKISDNEKSYLDKESGTYYIGKNWRILATMNIYDKDSLFDLSYAFMRRFVFINVGLPENSVFEELIDEFAQDCVGEINQEYLDKLKCLLSINQYRELGPAIFKDIIKYIESRIVLGDTYDILEEAILSYVIPQFEGLPFKILEKIDDFFDEKELNSKEIKEKLSQISGSDING